MAGTVSVIISDSRCDTPLNSSDMRGDIGQCSIQLLRVYNRIQAGEYTVYFGESWLLLSVTNLLQHFP